MGMKMDFKRYNMFIFLLGSFITFFGTQASLYILSETKSGLSFGFSLALGMIPQLIITPFVGISIDLS